jgi:hypothetical protein
MPAYARRINKPVKRVAKPKLHKPRTAPPPPPPSPPTAPSVHYEAGWTDSWSHRRCMHKHQTLIEAAQCAMPTGAGWYVFAVENGEGRELNEKEDGIVNGYRFRKSHAPRRSAKCGHTTRV